MRSDLFYVLINVLYPGSAHVSNKCFLKTWIVSWVDRGRFWWADKQMAELITFPYFMFCEKMC